MPLSIYMVAAVLVRWCDVVLDVVAQGTAVAGLSYAIILGMLRKAPRPLTLAFLPPSPTESDQQQQPQTAKESPSAAAAAAAAAAGAGGRAKLADFFAGVC